MTVNELYKKVKAIMFEKPTSTIYDSYLVENLNRLLQELFNENNISRVYNGKDKLESPQVIPSNDYLNTELTYEDEYVSYVIPLGLAAKFFIDDDLQKYSIFNTDYQNARVIAQKVVSKEKLKCH